MADEINTEGAVAAYLGGQGFDPAVPVRQSVMGAMGANPDQEARLQAAARTLGISPLAARSAPDEVQRQARLRAVDFGRMVQDYPATARLLLEQDRARVAHDDIGTLQAIESAVARAARYVVSADDRGGLVRDLAAGAYDLSRGAAGLFAGAAELAAPLLDPLAGTVLPENPLRRAAAGFRGLGADAAGNAKDLGGQPQGIVAGGVSSGVRSLGQNALMMPLALLNPALALGMMAGSQGGQSYLDAREAGLPAGQSAIYGASQAAIEYATERLPLQRLLGDLKAGTGAFKALAHNLAAEIPGEQLATVLQDLNEWATLHPQAPFSDYLKERPSAAAQTIVSTIVGVGGQVSVMQAVQRAADQATGTERRAQQAQQTAQALHAVAVLAEASKLRERDPATFAAFAQELADQDVPAVHVDARALLQSGVDLPAMAQAMPSVAQQLDQALQTGGDVVIPTGELLAGGQFAQALVDHVRTGPDAMSKVEADAYLKEHGERLQADVRRAIEAQQVDDAGVASRDAVRDQFAEQLQAAGRTADVARAEAVLVASFYASQGQRLGLSAEQMAERYPLQVQRTEAGGRLVLEQGAAVRAEPTGKISPISRRPVFDVFDASGNKLTTTHSADTAEQAVAAFNRSQALRANPERAPIPVVGLPDSAPAVRKASNWKQVRGQAFTNLDGDDGYLYHVTSAPAAAGIRERGLTPGAWQTFGGAYSAHSAGRVFLTERSGVSFWRERVENALHHHHDRPPAVVVLRIPKDKITVELLPDALGSDDARAPAYYATQTLEQSTRGQIAFGADITRQPSIITLLKTADLSTFIHELGHFFLQVQLDVAARLEGQAREGAGLAPGEQQVLDDARALLGWFGVQDTPEASALTQWHMLTPDEQREHHERFARGFERYSFEGNAPSVELQGMFQRFRAWLVAVYKQLKALNVELTDEVRGVMARMLATDEQIRLTEQARSLLPLFDSPDQAGMMAEEWADYQAQGEQATADAIDELQGRALRDMRWLRNARGRVLRRLQKDAEAQRREVRAEVRTKVMAEPVYRAWAFLTRKPGDDDKLAPATRPAAGRALDNTRDSLLVAIAKLGGISRESAQRDLSVSPDNLKHKVPVFGASSVFRAEGGLSADDMLQALTEAGYLHRLDEYGRSDLRELEELVGAELGGDPQHSIAYDYGAAAAEQAGREVANPDALQAGRLDLHALRQLGLPAEALERLQNAKMTARDGLAPDMVAGLFGFDSGDALARALAAATPPGAAIEGLTDQRMLERYGDLATPAAIERAADAAVANEARGRMIATEAAALERAVGPREVTGTTAKGRSITRSLMPRLAREWAQQMIGRLKVRDLRPGQYTAAEARAARNAAKASRASDLQTAAAEKRNELVQHYAAREAYAAQDEVDRGLRYLRKFDTDGTRKALDVDYLDQIDGLLERFDLRKQSLKAVDKRTALAAWVQAQEDAGLAPDIPAELLNEARRTSYRNLTLEEFRGLVDSVRQIEHLARLKHKLLTARDQREFEAIRDEIADGINAHAGNRKADTRTPTTNLGRVAQGFRRFWASHIRVATWANIFDGGQDGGPVWEHIIRPANEAGDREATMRAEATGALSAILAPVFKLGKMGGGGQWFESIGRSLNREARLAIALNTGNEGNLQRLLDGEGWTMQQLLPVLQSLTAAEWQAVQAIWDHLETYRPLIGAKERRVYGKEPAWVEAQPFAMRTADGQDIQVRGGYYPVKYDPAASQRAEEHSDAEAAKRQLQGAYTSATTRRSFTKSRAEAVKGRPLLYTLAGLYSGVNDVIHDLTHHEWLIDVNRLLKSGAIDAAIREHYGPEAKQQFKAWVQDVAEGERGSDAAVDLAVARLRQGISASGLGFNVMSAVMQPLGFTQSIVRVGAPWVGRGIARYIAGPRDLAREVVSRSEFMANRSRTRFRELNELRNKVQDQNAISELSGRYAYWLMMQMQGVVDVPTWWGAYEKALAAGESEERAIGLADQSVIDAQGGGQVKDTADIERGGPAQKLFTVFYSFMGTALNLGVAKTMTADKTAAGRAKLAADMLLIYTVPAVLGMLLKDALTPGDAGDDDLEKLARRLLAAQLDYLMGMMVVVREFNEVGKILSGADAARGYSGPAGLRLIGDTGRALVQVKQGELDDALRKALVNVAGDITGLPAAQTNRTITGVQALAEGQTTNPAAVVFGFQKP